MSTGSAARVGRGTAVNWVAWILARALALATLLMLARSLGVDELGALLSALAAGVLGAALATGGLADATARQAAAAGHGPEIATEFGRGDLMRGIRRFGAVLPLVLAVVIVITARSSDDFGASELIASSLLAITQGAITISAAVFRARNQPARFALATNLASSVGRAVIALLALVVMLSGEAVLWGFALLNAAVAIVTWQQAVAGLPRTSTTMKGVGALQLGGVVWSLLGNLDVVTVGLLLGAGKAGTYSVALRVAEFSAQFVIAISLFFLPEATRLAVQGQRERLIALYRSACRWSALTTLLAAGIGFVTAPQIAEIVLPDKAGTITTLLRILFCGYAVQGALGVSYATLSAAGAFRAIWISSIVGLPTLVAATIVLTQVWGLPGSGLVDADRLRGPEHLVDGAHDLRARGLADRRPLRQRRRRLRDRVGDRRGGVRSRRRRLRGRGLRRVGRRRPGGSPAGALAAARLHARRDRGAQAAGEAPRARR